MEEEIKMYLDEARDLMEKAVQHTQREFTKIRAGKASPEMLNGLLVDYYGTPTPITQVASVNTPDARSITIKPFEKSMIGKIEKAIKDSDLGIQPNNDGELIRLSMPPLTEERRQKLVKQVKQEGEAGKVSVRNIRKDINGSLKDLQKEGASEDAIKRAEEKVQKFTDEFISKVDDIVNKKEIELMTV
ncbi:MAG: ribosome recycling factor [Cytophagia bacterium]|nr:MAG: ribosome recycling factor [Cytophagales bacterium]TAG03340.1 MAG: ribosome recycling factor [Cytophagia bacterium]TAG42763.1 MAG: ribosome recycling factor [Cytophagia bacterium]TAH29719.1 MAG: ribosome recycling factor [Cytophagales bacterium]